MAGYFDQGGETALGECVGSFAEEATAKAWERDGFQRSTAQAEVEEVVVRKGFDYGVCQLGAETVDSCCHRSGRGSSSSSDRGEKEKRFLVFLLIPDIIDVEEARR